MCGLRQLARADGERLALCSGGSHVQDHDPRPTDPAALLSILELVRRRGYALDEGEHQPGLRCIGAPIRDQSGRAIGISLNGPAWRFPLAEVEPADEPPFVQ